MRWIASWLLLPALIIYSQAIHAWGHMGHAAIGVHAVEQLSFQTRLNLSVLLGSVWHEDIAEACNWPDEYRSADGGDWSSPLHYVNVPVDARRYRKSRDCPTGACVPEAVIRYARQLGDTHLAIEERRKAFAFLCHFTADLHQPLHVGYADDEGGNRVSVYFRNEKTNLHRYWDSDLIASRVDAREGLVKILGKRPNQEVPGKWTPFDVYGWTNESLSFTRNFVYPPERVIDDNFEARSWTVVTQQLDMASARLAAILEAVLQPEASTAP